MIDFDHEAFGEAVHEALNDQRPSISEEAAKTIFASARASLNQERIRRMQDCMEGECGFFFDVEKTAKMLHFIDTGEWEDE